MKKDRGNDREHEIIEEFFNAGLPAKTVSTLRKFFDSCYGRRLIVESSDSRFSVRPRIAQKMQEFGLVVLKTKGSILLAIVTYKGAEYANELFGD